MIRKLTDRLLLRGRWAYLRYLHLRDLFLMVSEDIDTMAVVGAGHGIAECALAIEFPTVHFTLTDIIAPGYPSYHHAMDICWKWSVNNVSFSVWNVLEPSQHRFDMIASTEVLEHIKDDKAAAERMVETARKYIYCLVPFATKRENADPDRRKHAWDRCQHFVAGYDGDDLAALFGPAITARGTYWRDRGKRLRGRLSSITVQSLAGEREGLIELAKEDLVDSLPGSSSEASGIKILVAK